MGYVTGSYKKVAVRAAAILTNSYVANTILETNSDLSTETLDCTGFNQLILYIDFTIGSLTDGRVKVEFSPNDSAYYQETLALVAEAGGTSTENLGEHVYGATGKYRVLIPIADKNIKISAKGTGTVTSSTMTIDAVLAKV